MPFQEQLSPSLIVAAYRGGYFPMPEPETGEILWYNPDPRAIIPLNEFHVSRSLRRTANKGRYTVTFNRDFSGVIDGCADRETTWISEGIKRAYIELFERGICHSVEVWNPGGKLVGGLYGLAQGGAFHAESMFSRETDVSKLALWGLVKRLQACGASLLEVQFLTPHLGTLGAREIKKSSYLQMLEAVAGGQTLFCPEPDVEVLP
jgi:leucyl/phenylalanyl-tRNA---protein transferase